MPFVERETADHAAEFFDMRSEAEMLVGDFSLRHGDRESIRELFIRLFSTSVSQREAAEVLDEITVELNRAGTDLRASALTAENLRAQADRIVRASPAAAAAIQSAVSNSTRVSGLINQAITGGEQLDMDLEAYIRDNRQTIIDGAVAAIRSDPTIIQTVRTETEDQDALDARVEAAIDSAVEAAIPDIERAVTRVVNDALDDIDLEDDVELVRTTARGAITPLVNEFRQGHIDSNELRYDNFDVTRPADDAREDWLRGTRLVWEGGRLIVSLATPTISSIATAYGQIPDYVATLEAVADTYERIGIAPTFTVGTGETNNLGNVGSGAFMIFPDPREQFSWAALLNVVTLVAILVLAATGIGALATSGIGFVSYGAITATSATLFIIPVSISIGTTVGLSFWTLATVNVVSGIRSDFQTLSNLTRTISGLISGNSGISQLGGGVTPEQAEQNLQSTYGTTNLAAIEQRMITAGNTPYVVTSVNQFTNEPFLREPSDWDDANPGLNPSARISDGIPL